MNKKIENAMNLYLEGIRDGHYVEAVNKYTGDRYTQHSTGVRDGKEGFIEFFGPFVERNPYRDIQIVRKLMDGQYVFIQAFQNINNGEAKWVTTDFFDTDQDDRIIEHWDVIAPYCDKTPSGHTTVDGITELTDLDKTEENKELVRRFLKDAFMVGGNPQNLGNYISNDMFIQHNNNMKDGLDDFEKVTLGAEKSLRYEEIVLMVGQGNFVATLSHVFGTEQGAEKELCQVDLFRIENGMIVEHWDNSELVPEENVNGGKF